MNRGPHYPVTPPAPILFILPTSQHPAISRDKTHSSNPGMARTTIRLLRQPSRRDILSDTCPLYPHDSQNQYATPPLCYLYHPPSTTAAVSISILFGPTSHMMTLHVPTMQRTQQSITTLSVPTPHIYPDFKQAFLTARPPALSPHSLRQLMTFFATFQTTSDHVHIAPFSSFFFYFFLFVVYHYFFFSFFFQTPTSLVCFLGFVCLHFYC